MNILEKLNNIKQSINDFKHNTTKETCCFLDLLSSIMYQNINGVLTIDIGKKNTNGIFESYLSNTTYNFRVKFITDGDLFIIFEDTYTSKNIICINLSLVSDMSLERIENNSWNKDFIVFFNFNNEFDYKINVKM